jgi:hypothetical protein
VTRTCWIVASVAVLASASLSAQDAPGEVLRISSYARAEALDRPSAKALVKNLAVVPHWIGASDDFW